MEGDQGERTRSRFFLVLSVLLTLGILGGMVLVALWGKG
jgi:cytochrome c-type biogenesis protein CcmE